MQVCGNTLQIYTFETLLKRRFESYLVWPVVCSPAPNRVICPTAAAVKDHTRRSGAVWSGSQGQLTRTKMDTPLETMSGEDMGGSGWERGEGGFLK
ncbi:hypothetical protein RRG08_024580 [Elysia crispata]|uniref:Uncharacterized protein n=1 Tax=Elysia crispata TaxID=231223 RepID=A0AAE1DPD2_9GAST|nr:hypothetical protein RRG08_024580 [Elysia crispata]